MSRGRTFTFSINNYTDKDWTHIQQHEPNKKCEYIIASKCSEKIFGFIRFSNPKCFNAVKRLFINNDTILKIEKNNDAYYREIISATETFFEAGTTIKNTKTKNILQLLKDKNTIIENQNTIINQHKKQLIEEKDKIIMIYKDQITELIETFKECKGNNSDQIKQITNLCMTIAKSTPTTITTNNNNNNNFNLNFFLNEYCKDAINIVDFAKSIQIKLEDVLLYKKIGHAEAVSQIFDNAYKNLDLKMRPMHCTDVKRETLYVRNEDKWINDETKEFSEKAIDIISNNSFRQFKQWKDANPDYTTNEDKKQEYTLLMKQLVGGSSDREMEENLKKIFKNISKNTQIDKEQTIQKHSKN
jgi:hypothetical protein